MPAVISRQIMQLLAVLLFVLAAVTLDSSVEPFRAFNAASEAFVLILGNLHVWTILGLGTRFKKTIKVSN